MEHDDPGQKPPPPPRPIPRGFFKKRMFANISGILAIVFLCLGLPFIIVGMVLGTAVMRSMFVFAVLGALFCLVAAGLILFVRRALRRIAKVISHGEFAAGKITDIQPNYSVRVNGRNPIIVRYTFLGPDGTREGEYQTLDQRITHKKPGNTIHVLYDPSHPDRNLPYPLL